MSMSMQLARCICVSGVVTREDDVRHNQQQHMTPHLGVLKFELGDCGVRRGGTGLKFVHNNAPTANTTVECRVVFFGRLVSTK